jgi:hypothetical protein
MIAVKPETETAGGCIYGDNCPFHAENPPFNAKARAAMQEARDIMSGKMPAKWYHSSLLQNPVGFAQALAVFRPTGYKTAIFSDCCCKTEVLQQPHSIEEAREDLDV